MPDLAGLVRRGRQMLLANRERAQQSTTGDLRRDRRTWVYRRERAGCLRCGTPVRIDQLAPSGYERTVYWCPSCQPVTSMRMTSFCSMRRLSPSGVSSAITLPVSMMPMRSESWSASSM